jgi:DNA-binding winged helix-turn-helix (wHTH) protein/Tol biopolymer transport system component
VPESTHNADPKTRVTQFGVFEVDLQAGELRKSGLRIKLQDQPLQILTLLLEHPGEVVSREQLRQRLWPADTFVDFDHSLNSAVKKLRQALGDDSDNPRFIETLPRRGYRFIVPVKQDVLPSDQPPIEKPPASTGTGSRPKRHWLGIPGRGILGRTILGAAVVAVAAVILWLTAIRNPRAPKVLRFTQLTNDGQAKSGPMATDGSRVYFNETLPGQRAVILQVSVKGGEAVPLPGPLKQPAVLDLSRDGTELLLADGAPENEEGIGPCSLWLQPVAGGSPRRVGTVRAVDARFGGDGTSIIYGNGNDVYSVNTDGSSPRKLLTAGYTPFAFRFSPDAQVFRFTQLDGQVDTMDIMEAAANGTGLHKMFSGCCGEWTSDGRFFVFQNRRDLRLNLWALPERRRFRWWKRDAKAIQLTAGPLNFQDLLLSKDNKQIFAVGGSNRAEVIRYDSRSGQFVSYLSGISAESLAFSRDGRWVTYLSFPEGTLWRSKVDGSERLQLTFPPMRVFLPRWSPDGKQIVFNATFPDKTPNIYLISSAGGTPQRVLPSEQSQTDVNWSPDGNSLVFGTFFVPNMPIYTIDLRSKRITSLPGSAGLFSPRWSPDGRYIAALTTDQSFKLMLFDLVTQKWTQVFGSPIGYLLWSHDGTYIYFQDMRNAERIVRLRVRDRKIENIVDIKNVGRLTTGTFVDWFGLAPDDSPLFARDISTSEIYALEMDWP